MGPTSEEPGAGRELSAELVTALARVRLFVCDVDGVLTDGRVVYLDGQEQQAFSVHDGAAFAWLRAAGVRSAWISGRGCAATKRRAMELGVQYLRARVADKAIALGEVQDELGLSPEETVAIGDDLQDLALAQRAAVFAAPANARPEVRARAALITRASGGEGAVRELAEHVLRARGAWDGLLARYGA